MCLIYRLADWMPTLDYTTEHAVHSMAVKMTTRCSIVGSVWISIKYLGQRPFIPNADAMSKITGCSIEEIVAAEQKDLRAIQWNVSQFTNA